MANPEQEQDALLSEQQDSEALLAHRTWHFKRLSVLSATLAACALAALALATEQPFALRGKDGIQYSDPIEVDVDEATKEFSTYSYDAQPAGGLMYSNHQTPVTAYGYNTAPVSPSYTSSSTSKSARCILCNPNQCTLDLTGKGAWTSCPASQKYFSEAHCKCVSSCSSDPSPIVSSCRLCQNCYTKTCNIGGKYLKCGATTPYWEPNKQTCASACQQGPNVAPAPTPYTVPTVAPMQLPTVAPLPPTPTLAPLATVAPLSPTAAPAAKCGQDTGGQCKWMGCSSSRGATSCKSGKCLCGPGYCNKDGKCMKYADFQKQAEAESHKCVTNTAVSCRWSDCDRKMGLTMCDSLTAGHGSYKCLCKKHYCWDSLTKHCVRQ